MNEAQKYLLQDLSVAIVDDHALILEGFKSLMQGCNAKNVETFGCAADLIVKAIDRGYINASEIVKGNKNDKNT